MAGTASNPAQHCHSIANISAPPRCGQNDIAERSNGLLQRHHPAEALQFCDAQQTARAVSRARDWRGGGQGARDRRRLGNEPAVLSPAGARGSRARTGTAACEHGPRRSAQHAGQLLEASAEAIPLDAHCVDTVVTTWTLCSIPQASTALAEMRRVLRPGGKLLFVEHGLAPDKGVRWWQDRLTPAWRRISGGCHLNRPIQSMIEGAGFRLDKIETGYIPGPRPMTFMYEGSARPN